MTKPFMRFQYGVWIIRTSRDGGDYISWHVDPFSAYLGWEQAKQFMGSFK